MKKRINITMEEDVHKEMRRKAIDKGVSFSQLLEELSKEYLEKEKSLSSHD